MLFGHHSLRATARITLFFFTWMTLYPTLAAATPPAPASGPAPSLPERNLLDDLRAAALRAKAKAERGEAHEDEAQRLLERAAELDDDAREAEAEFAAVEQHLEAHGLPEEIKQRHRQAVADYRAKLRDLKTRLGEFRNARGRKDRSRAQRALTDLADFLQKEQKTRPQQPFDPKNLPFRTPDDKIRAPKEKKEELDRIIRPQKPVKVAAAELSPGMLAQAEPVPSTAPTPEDVAETEDVSLTPAIRAQAEALHKNPVEIYHFVRNTIEFLPTYGSIQGADLTLQTRRGNAFDTASLLIALLRASNIPARYAYGTIQLPAGEVMNWVGGVTTPEAAQSLLGQGGIPNVALVAGGQIAAFKLEHVWVEAFVDYVPSRGAKHRQGDTWVPLDASFKQYTYTSPLNIPAIAGFNIAGDLAHLLQSASLDEANASVTGVDGDFLKSRLTAYQTKLAEYSRSQPNPLTLDQAFGAKTIRTSNLPILAGALPYPTIAIGSRFAAVPDHLRHTLTLEFFATSLDRSLGAPALTQTFSLPRLQLQRLGITYVPATADDAAVLQSLEATQADSIPLYLVQVKPQIKLDDTVVNEGSAMGMGADHYLDVVVSGPQGQRRLSYSRIAGDEMVVGVDPAGIGFDQVRQRFQTTPSDTAAENLHQMALHYWMESDLFNRLGQTAYGAAAVRLPSTGVFSSPLSVIYNFGMPRTGYYLKRSIDIKLSQHAVAAPDPAKRFDYIAQIGVIGSYLESSIQEQLFHNWQGTGLSTIQVFLDANAQQIPIYSLTAANASSLLSRLQIPADALADIQTAFATGNEVRVPERTPTKAVGVSGIGYEIRDPQTGSASYRIWGGTNGGEGDTPCAERQRRPLTQVVRDVVLTVIVLEMLVLAGWYLPGLIGGLAGVAGEAAPVLAAIMVSVGLSALAFPATAGDDLCEPIDKGYHLGGDQIHNQCADSYPPNEFMGSDACVAGKNFDAISGGRTILWEVKSENYNNNNGFTRSRIIEGWLKDINDDMAVAKVTCAHRNFKYHFLVGDARFVAPLKEQITIGGATNPDQVIPGPPWCTSIDK